jgi:hypothetical protein
VLLGLGLLAAAMLGALLAVVLPRAPELRVLGFVVGPDGRDRVRVGCTRCPPGTRLALRGVATALEAGQATLIAPAPLAVGANTLEVTLLEPGAQPQETSVSVPVAFRVETALEGLGASPPYALVVVAAPPGATVELDGQPVALADGRATLRVPVGAASEGEAPGVTEFRRDVVVRVRSGPLDKQTVARVRAPVTPLLLEAPAPGHSLKGGALAVEGRTLAGAAIEVSRGAGPARALQADARGRFAGTLGASELPSALTVTARAPGHALRSVLLPLSRSPAPLGPAVSLATLAPGLAATLEGTVVESAVRGALTSVLLDVAAGCGSPPCLVRASYGEAVELAPGARARVTGEVRSVAPPLLRASAVIRLTP